MNRQKKRSFLLGGAIAFGVLVIVLLNGFTAGLVLNVQENFTHFFAGHVYLSGMEKTESGRVIRVIRDDALLRETLEELAVGYASITKRSSFTGTLIFSGKSILQKVDGVDFDREIEFLNRLTLTAGSLEKLVDPKALILSEPMARKLNVEVGETILAKMRTLTGQYNVGEFTLVAVIADPGIIGNLSAYAHLDEVNELLNIAPGEYQTMSVFLKGIDGIDREAGRIYERLSEKAEMNPREMGGTTPWDRMKKLLMNEAGAQDWEGRRYELLTLNDMLSEVHLVVDVLNTIGFVVLLILLLIIMVGIMNTFRMVMMERTSEIGTMRALGVQRGGIRDIFLLEALFLSLGASLVGLLLSLIAMGGLSLVYFDPSSPFFMFMKKGYPHFEIVPLQVALNVFLVVALSLGAAYLPARRAARVDPGEAIRVSY
jgi:putative ABC transport system permease protein